MCRSYRGRILRSWRFLKISSFYIRLNWCIVGVVVCMLFFMVSELPFSEVIILHHVLFFPNNLVRLLWSTTSFISGGFRLSKSSGLNVLSLPIFYRSRLFRPRPIWVKSFCTLYKPSFFRLEHLMGSFNWTKTSNCIEDF